MDLDFTEEQIMLKTSARDFLMKECPKSLVRSIEESEQGFSPDLWMKMAELGWQGLIIDEKFGGSNLSFFELALIIEEMGRNIAPGPFLSTVVCASAIQETGTQEQKEHFLPLVASGKMILTLALTEPSNSWQPAHVNLRAVSNGDNYLLNGIKLFVPDANVANYLLVVARTGTTSDPGNGITLFLVDAKSPGIECERQLSMALDNKCSIYFNNVVVSNKNILGTSDKGWDIAENILMKGRALKVAEMSGGCQACLEMTNAYVKDRKQYGKSIGSNQVIQHYLADMWGYTDRTRNIGWEANWKVSEGIATNLDIAIAKSWANEAYSFVSERGVHCHGAIGTTRDHDIGLYFRRAKVSAFDYGDTDYLRSIIAQEIGL
jgi:alkylation response protein AidB-like acyl-CoA dehydrogenase